MVFEDPASLIMAHYKFSFSRDLATIAKSIIGGSDTILLARSSDRGFMIGGTMERIYPLDTILYPIYRHYCECRLFKSLEGRSTSSLSNLIEYMHGDSVFSNFLLGDQIGDREYYGIILMSQHPESVQFSFTLQDQQFKKVHYRSNFGPCPQ